VKAAFADLFEAAPRIEYIKIIPHEAKKIMGGSEDFIILDVRRADEFIVRHIAGALNIPHTEIAAKAAAELPDKNVIILVYCLAGVRSKTAAETLIGLGYTNVFDIGGINDFPCFFECGDCAVCGFVTPAVIDFIQGNNLSAPGFLPDTVSAELTLSPESVLTLADGTPVSDYMLLELTVEKVAEPTSSVNSLFGAILSFLLSKA
jgi:rhodanese-related sulfurtransferase